MPKCFKCSLELPTVKALEYHFKFIHKFNIADNEYGCAEGLCRRKFSNLKTLVSHLKKVHDISKKDKPQFVQNVAQGASFNAGEQVDNFNVNVPINCEEEISEQPDFAKELKLQSEVVVSKLYAQPNLPRNIVQTVVDDVSEFLLSGFVGLLKTKVINALESHHHDEVELNNITRMFECLEKPFDHLRTEHRRLQCLAESGDYIPPIPVTLGHRLKEVRHKGVVKAKMIEVEGHFIPLRKVFIKFLSFPNVLDDMLAYEESLKIETERISSFLQGDLWKRKRSKFQESDIVLPLLVYSDDYEINNPLGSHCVKLCGVYVKFAGLPPECASSVQNILTAMIVEAEFTDTFENKASFKVLINELIFLEVVGIDVQAAGELRHVYIVVGLVIGDNLGLNSILGFAKGFTANFFCRLCKIHRNDAHVTIDLDDGLLRNIENYIADVATQNVTLTGVHEECVFNRIPSFHVVDNWALDVCHDLQEGVDHYIMLLIVRQFINVDSYFTIELLNDRIQFFDYGCDNSNRPPEINPSRLVEGDKLKMSASEMDCFVRYFSLLVGDTVPVNNEHWLMYLNLRTVHDILMAKSIPKNSVNGLLVAGQELCRLYLKHSGHLEPKFHFLLHQILGLLKVGPPVHHSAIRFESKHQLPKKYLKASQSRKNSSLSAATKTQLNLCHMFKAGKGIRPVDECGHGSIVNLHSYDFYESLKDFLPQGKAYCPSYVVIKGTKYFSGIILVTDVEESLPVFSLLHEIVLVNDSPHFVCQKLFTVTFREHYHSYEVRFTNDWCITAQKDLLHYHPLSYQHLPDEKYYVTLRCIL